MMKAANARVGDEARCPEHGTPEYVVGVTNVPNGPKVVHLDCGHEVVVDRP